LSVFSLHLPALAFSLCHHFRLNSCPLYVPVHVPSLPVVSFALVSAVLWCPLCSRSGNGLPCVRDPSVGFCPHAARTARDSSNNFTSVLLVLINFLIFLSDPSVPPPHSSSVSRRLDLGTVAPLCRLLVLSSGILPCVC